MWSRHQDMSTYVIFLTWSIHGEDNQMVVQVVCADGVMKVTFSQDDIVWQKQENFLPS